MLFAWDPQKDIDNQMKHGVSFTEAKEVFDDPLHVSIMDHRFTYFEERWITIGQTLRTRIIVVANLFFDEEGEEVIRIISAREASLNERNQYEDA
ncbi:BrnT family toxin [Treponema sp.]